MSKTKLDASIIPYGYYCYSGINGTKPCSYWSLRNNKPKYANGYCAFLKKGDWDINKEKRWRSINPKTNKPYGRLKSANELNYSLSCLWDKIKECDINQLKINKQKKNADKHEIKDCKNHNIKP